MHKHYFANRIESNRTFDPQCTTFISRCNSCRDNSSANCGASTYLKEHENAVKFSQSHKSTFKSSPTKRNVDNRHVHGAKGGRRVTANGQAMTRLCAHANERRNGDSGLARYFVIRILFAFRFVSHCLQTYRKLTEGNSRQSSLSLSLSLESYT